MEAEKAQDKRTKALAEFYKKNFVEAAELFDKAADEDEAELAKIREKARQKTLHAYENRKDAGNSFMNIYRFSDALEQYNKALHLLSKEEFPQEWALGQNLSGIALEELGIRVEGEKGKSTCGTR